MAQGLETMSGKAEQLGFYEVVLGDPVGTFARLEAYRRLTASDLLRVARRYLGRAGRTIIEAYPDGGADTRADSAEAASAEQRPEAAGAEAPERMNS